MSHPAVVRIEQRIKMPAPLPEPGQRSGFFHELPQAPKEAVCERGGVGVTSLCVPGTCAPLHLG